MVGFIFATISGKVTHRSSRVLKFDPSLDDLQPCTTPTLNSVVHSLSRQSTFKLGSSRTEECFGRKHVNIPNHAIGAGLGLVGVV